MKIIFTLIFLLFSLIELNSCRATTQQSDQLLEFKQLEKIREGSKVFIIPGSGCTGCITDIENTAIHNLNSDSLYFIFTRLTSFKLFRNRFGNTFIESKNVLLDTGNIFQYKNNESDIYPVMYKKIKGKIIFQKYLKPLN